MAIADRDSTEVERLVRQAVQTGQLVDVSAGKAELDDPSLGSDWSPDRTVQAEVLVELLTFPPADALPARPLKLEGARIMGNLDLEAATLVRPLLLRGCYLDKRVNLQEAQAPAIRLQGCWVPGIDADQLTTRGDLELAWGFTCRGTIFLRGAQIGGRLDLVRARLQEEKDTWTLNALGIVVREDVFLTGGFSANGPILLGGASIGGLLQFSRSSISEGSTLSAPGLKARRVMLGPEASIHGSVDLRGARIQTELTINDIALNCPNGPALLLSGVQADELVLRPKPPVDGIVDLTSARVRTYSDMPTGWSRQLRLRDFTYETLNDREDINVSARLAWLNCDTEGYAPQPYEQLAEFYRRVGHDQAARRVAIAKQRERRTTLSWPNRVWSVLLDGLVGYGYRTWLAGVWLLLAWMIGTLAFSFAQHHGQLTAAKRPTELQHFNPLVYSIDVLLPIVNLGQDGGWIPHRLAALCYWLLTLVGWILTTAVVAGLTGVLKRE